MRHKGSCHCGTVKFEFEAPTETTVTECDCSICKMTGYQHVFIPQTDFKITQGQEKLTNYSFNTHAAKHKFCQICGIKAFYIPRSHPDSYSVNLRCIKPGTLKIAEFIAFSGKNWENNIDCLRKETS